MKYDRSIYSRQPHTPKRYRLGNMDMYSVAFMHTCMENASLFQLTFKTEIDGKRLTDAVVRALDFFPLFGCELVYDKEYYLQEFKGDVSKAVKHCALSKRPVIFGNKETTGGYLFQICYYGKTISFEWCHAVTDGKGSIAFLSKICSIYCGEEPGALPKDFPLTLPYETIDDPTVKGFGQKKQAAGFSAKSMKIIPNGYRCYNHVIKLDTTDILKLGKLVDATPAAILAPLLSKAIRMHLPENVKNRNVSCGVVVDGRASLHLETMHNCVFNKVITYTDRMDSFEFFKQATIYRSILDLFLQPENLIACAGEMLRSLDFLYRMRPGAIKRGLMKTIARIVKSNMNNFGLTYIGKVPFSDAVKAELDDVMFCSWPDIGYMTVAVVDLNGILTITISENYQNKCVVPTFIELCKASGLQAEVVDEYIFEQANVRI